MKDILKNKSLTTTVGDEGGFAPNLRSSDEAIELILEAVEKTPYKLEKDLFIALDVAASELYNGKYNLISEKKQLSTSKMVDYLKSLVDQYPIVSIEDGLDENDWEGSEAKQGQPNSDYSTSPRNYSTSPRNFLELSQPFKKAPRRSRAFDTGRIRPG